MSEPSAALVWTSAHDATPRLRRFSTRDPEAQVNLTKRPVAAHGQNMAVHIAHAISFCFTPGLGFTGLGGLILKNTSRWSFFAAAAAGSTTVGIPTGIAWYALFRHLERRREHLRYGDDDGGNVAQLAFWVTQPTVFATLALVVGTAIVDREGEHGNPLPEGMSRGDVLRRYGVGYGAFLAGVGGLYLCALVARMVASRRGSDVSDDECQL